MEKKDKMEHHDLKTSRTAHIYTHNAPNDTTKYIWFIGHGFGQLASSIIRKFMHFDTEHYVVSPEGLSRFYFNLEKGIVGASWMTKLDRLSEIDDYVEFLDNVYAKFVTPYLKLNTKVIFLGFSQGGICFTRWMAISKPHCDYFITWGSALPEDVDYVTTKSYFETMLLFFICGDNDQFFSLERMEKYLDFLKTLPFQVNYQRFEGKHEILVPVLNAFFETHVKIKQPL